MALVVCGAVSRPAEDGLQTLDDIFELQSARGAWEQPELVERLEGLIRLLEMCIRRLAC